MAEPALEIKFTLPIGGLPDDCRAPAEQKAREAFVMELLRQGGISAGRAAELLGVDRWQLGDLMYAHRVSPFGESMTLEELEQEVTETVRALEVAG